MIKIFVMQTCPDCTAVKETVKGDANYEVIDIGEHVRNLKQFLSIRDTHPAFDSIRGTGTVGIPCFVMDDGQVFFSAESAGIRMTKLHSNEDIAEGAMCSLDGNGC